jgi:hypothetical protein
MIRYLPLIAEQVFNNFRYIYFGIIFLCIMLMFNELFMNTIISIEFMLGFFHDDELKTPKAENLGSIYIDTCEYIVIIFLVRRLCIRQTFHELRVLLVINCYVLIIYLILTYVAIVPQINGENPGYVRKVSKISLAVVPALSWWRTFW